MRKRETAQCNTAEPLNTQPPTDRVVPQMHRDTAGEKAVNTSNHRTYGVTASLTRAFPCTFFCGVMVTVQVPGFSNLSIMKDQTTQRVGI